jgi:type I restriction enzyme S subunit
VAEYPLVEIKKIAGPKGLVGGPFGSSLVGRDYMETGIPVIRGENLNHGRRIGGKFVFVGRQKFEQDLARNSAIEGDLIYTQRGTLGQVAIVEPGPTENYVVSQSQMRLRVDPQIADPLYVYYASSAPHFLRQIDDNAISTGVPHINLGILSRLTVPLPPLPVQRGMAEVLGSLDDKIAANAKLVTTTDELSRSKYSSMLDGATEEPLSSTARFVNGRNFTKNATGTGRVVIRIAELNSGIGGSTVWNDVEASDDNVARPGDLLFAWSGSLTVRRWYLDEGIVNQHIFKVIPNGNFPKWLVHQLLLHRLEGFRAIAADKATTMGHIQRRHLDELVRVPLPEVVADEHETMAALWGRALKAEQENQLLATTRDALLPALMSGRLTVRQAERIAEDPITTDEHSDDVNGSVVGAVMKAPFASAPGSDATLW